MTRWMLAMVAAVALFAAACGGDSDGDDAAPETSAVAADGEADGEGTTATTAAGSEGTSAPKSDIEVSGDPNSAWCGLADDVQDQLDTIAADPFSLFSEEGIATLTSALDQAVQVAPPEIRSDVALSRETFAEIGALLEEYDFDLLSIPPEELEAIDQAGQEAAADRIEAYNEQVCGIEAGDGTTAGDPGDSGDPGDAPSAGGSDEAVDAFVEGLTASLPITEDQARCLAEELDLGALAAGGNLDPNDPELLDQLFAVLGECDISITDLAG